VTETNVFQLSQPGTFADPLTEVLRNGARALLAQAVEAEVAALLGCHADKLTDDGRQRLVRHGHLPEREIMTGIGPVAVRCPRVRDRVDEGCERIRFSSAILPPYARRSKSLEVLIPILYLKGVSTGDFEEALVALLGKDAGGLSASTIRHGRRFRPNLRASSQAGRYRLICTGSSKAIRVGCRARPSAPMASAW
jgi:putative transposase